MAEPQTVLFQEGIPDIFFPELESRGCRIYRFATAADRALEMFNAHRDAAAIFFRANFAFGHSELAALPQLRLASLVSTGSDNIDIAAIARRKIQFISGEGANARAVFDYVIQALLFGGFNPAHHSVGIVGAGRVGSQVLRFLNSCGVKAAFYDPLLTEVGSLAEALNCDFVSFHTPLTPHGPHKTQGMLNEEYFHHVEKNIRIIQTCRGGIWNPRFYATLPTKHIEILAQDVYPTEPPDGGALARAEFSTPHIAGYSTHGRLGGILKGIQALFPDFSASAFWPKGAAWFLDAEAAAFAEQPGAFAQIRDAYDWRKEFWEYNALEQAAFRSRFGDIDERFFIRLFVK